MVWEITTRLIDFIHFSCIVIKTLLILCSVSLIWIITHNNQITNPWCFVNIVALFANIISGDTVIQDTYLPVTSETIAASGNLTYTDEIRDVPLLQICVHKCVISQSCYQFTYNMNTAACFLKMCNKDLKS